MASFENLEIQKSFKYLREVELVAQDILTLKEEKLQLAHAQNKFREALNGLKNTEDRKTWIQVGSVYIERPVDECKIILQDEISKAEDDLKKLQDEIKEKVYKLRDLEHEPRLEGFTLKPISASEAKALHKGFGLI
ncbi:pdrg1 prefoldin-like subunit [Leptinotarsa decemlineata]|uniref:pdrg1 prefoldin-like subunit n=1 Tax=Leptinotarsa decemlineata TaxID=7539 RepID=UPI000C25191E|nr:uncharacterized protein LOC111502669 [Leptinotarsa decemlineata]